MATILEQLKSKGIDTGAPANYTDNQLESIRVVLAKVDAEAADVVVAALKGYNDTIPSLWNQGAQPGTVQAVTGKMRETSDALDAFSDDDVYDWLVAKVEEARKLNPHKAGLSFEQKQEATKASKPGQWWLVGLAVVLVLVVVKHKSK